MGNWEGPSPDLVNTTTLIFKQYIYIYIYIYIYAARCKKISPTFIGALTKVVDYQKIEYCIALKVKKLKKHGKKLANFLYSIVSVKYSIHMFAQELISTRYYQTA